MLYSQLCIYQNIFQLFFEWKNKKTDFAPSPKVMSESLYTLPPLPKFNTGYLAEWDHNSDVQHSQYANRLYGKLLPVNHIPFSTQVQGVPKVHQEGRFSVCCHSEQMEKIFRDISALNFLLIRNDQRWNIPLVIRICPHMADDFIRKPIVSDGEGIFS